MYFINAGAVLLALVWPLNSAANSPPPIEYQELEAAPIHIGLLAAAEPTAESLAAGAAGAVADINAAGGVQGRPLNLITVAAPSPWRDGASLMARLVFEEDIVALIGPTSGDAAHVAAQIATLKRIPVLTLSSEGSLTQAMDPWVFRGIPADREQAGALLRWAFTDPRGKRAAVAVPDGRAGRERLAAIRQACRELGVHVETVIQFPERLEESSAGMRIRMGESVDVLLLWLDPKPALALLEELKKGAVPNQILGSMRLDQREFLSRVPRWTEGLALPWLRGDVSHVMSSPVGDAPSRSSQSQKHHSHHSEIDLGAALGCDMVRTVAATILRTGPEPALIRDALAGGVSLAGESGTIRFDLRGNRKGAIPIGILQGGNLVPAPSHHRTDASPSGSLRPAHPGMWAMGRHHL